MVKRSDFIWGGIFLLLWMGYNGMIPLPQKTALVVGVGLVLYSYFRFNLYTFLKVGLALPFLGNEYIVYIFGISLLPVLLLLKSRRGFVVTKPQYWIGILFFWCLFSYILSQFIESNLGAFWAYALTFGSPLILFPLAVQEGRKVESVLNLTRFLMMCIIWQSFLIAYHAIVNKWYLDPGDWAVGSTRQPEISFLFAGCLLFPITANFIEKYSWSTGYSNFFIFNKRWFRLILIGWLGLMLHLTHTRILNYCFLIALGVGLPSLLLFRKLHYIIKWKKIIFIGLSISGLTLFFIYRLITVPSTTFGATYLIYITRPDYNHKIIFLKRALKEIPEEFNTWLTGTGPGTVGTRAANSRAYDTMFKAYGSQLPSFVPPFTSAPARKFFVDLYQKSYATMWWRSKTLAAPFSSFISLFVELGIVGLCVFLVFVGILQLSFIRLSIYASNPFFKVLGIALYLATLTLCINAFFDTYFEKPLIMAPYWIVAGLAVGQLKSLRNRPQRIFLQ